MAEVSRAVRTYLDHLSVERGLAANTLQSYRRDLRRYSAHLAAIGIADLGAAYLGGATLTALHAAGRVTELVPGSLVPAAAALGWPVAPSTGWGF